MIFMTIDFDDVIILFMLQVKESVGHVELQTKSGANCRASQAGKLLVLPCIGASRLLSDIEAAIIKSEIPGTESCIY